MRFFSFLFVLLFLGLPAHAATLRGSTTDPTGLWLTENQRSAVGIMRCPGNKDLLCGKVRWIIQDGMQTDSKNPDPAKRATPMCGLFVLKDFHKDDAHNWIDGTIYKADEGAAYSGTLEMLEDGTLKVHGYVGISLLGKSQIWTRVMDKNYPPCKVVRSHSTGVPAKETSVKEP